MASTDQMCALADRVRAEYQEMPGLSLTAPQASRLWGIDRSECEQVLLRLVMEGVLYHTLRGAYVAAPSMREHM